MLSHGSTLRRKGRCARPISNEANNVASRDTRLTIVIRKQTISLGKS